MFELDINKLKEQSMQFVDTAKKAALDIADKGKNQLDLATQKTRLSKAYEQLGTQVYRLHKAGEENRPLIDKYIENIEEIEQSIAEIKARMTDDEVAGTEQAEDAAPAPETASAEEKAEEPIEEEEIRPRGETKTCPVCNAEVDADALFCNHCGAQL